LGSRLQETRVNAARMTTRNFMQVLRLILIYIAAGGGLAFLSPRRRRKPGDFSVSPTL
jgi:hypothetical protein